MEQEIHDIALLKRLTKEAEELTEKTLDGNPHWHKAYKQIAAGTGLLWRLIEQAGNGGGKPVKRS